MTELAGRTPGHRTKPGTRIAPSGAPWVLPPAKSHEKTIVLVSDLVRQKPGCTATEDGERLEISDLESRRLVLSM